MRTLRWTIVLVSTLCRVEVARISQIGVSPFSNSQSQGLKRELSKTDRLSILMSPLSAVRKDPSG